VTNKERIVYTIETEWDAKSRAALDALQKQANNTEKAVGNMSNNVQKAGKSTRSAGYAAQNASYQIADFFVMIQGGISPLRSLTTQLPQLLAGFGPLGAVMGAVAAVGASLFVAFQNMGESAEASAKRIKAFGDAVEGLGTEENGTLAQFRKAIESADVELRKLIEAQYILAGLEANKQLDAATKSLNEYFDALANVGNRSDYEIAQNFELFESQQIAKIKSDFEAINDAAAKTVLDLSNSFKDGSLTASDFAYELSRLAAQGLIDSDSTSDIVKVIGQFEQAERAAKDLNGELYGDKPTLTLIDKKAIIEAEALIANVSDGVSRFYDELFNLETVRFEIGEDQFQEAFTALKNKFADDLLPEIKVELELSKAEQELNQFADSLKRSLDPMIEYREQVFKINSALLLNKISEEEATAAIKALNDEMLKEVAIRNKRLASLKQAGRALLEGVEPARAYRREVLEAKEALAAIGATGPQTAAVIDKITDSYLQFVEVTAKRKPENPLDQFDLQGYEGVIQDMEGAIEGFGDSFADSILDATESGMESFKAFADFVIKEIARIALKNLVIQPLVNSLTNLFPGGTGATTVGEVETVTGGIARASVASPTAIAGSAMSVGSSSGGRSAVNVNVNNYGNDEVEVQERKTSRGIEIDVLIKAAVNKGLAGGDFDSAMRSSYGSRRLAY
jgi:hypothetical protein